MQLEIYQWLVPILSVFFIVRIIRQYLRKGRNKGYVVLWLGFWIGVTLLAIIPNELTHFLASALGFKSNISAIIFLSLGLLFLMVFYLSNELNKSEAQVTELVRAIAKDRHRQSEMLQRIMSKLDEQQDQTGASTSVAGKSTVKKKHANRPTRKPSLQTVDQPTTIRT